MGAKRHCVERWGLRPWLVVLALLAGAPAGANQPLVGLVDIASKRTMAPWPLSRQGHPIAMMTLPPGGTPLFIQAARAIHGAAHWAKTDAHVIFATPNHLLSEVKALAVAHGIGSHSTLPVGRLKAVPSAAAHAASCYGAKTPLLVLRALEHIAPTQDFAHALARAWQTLGERPNRPILVGPPGGHPATAPALVAMADAVMDIDTALHTHGGIDGWSYEPLAGSSRVTSVDSFQAIAHILASSAPQPLGDKGIVGSLALVEGGQLVATGTAHDSLVFGDATHERQHGAHAETVVVLNGIERVRMLRSGPGLQIVGGRPVSADQLLVPLEIHARGASRTIWISRTPSGGGKPSPANTVGSESIRDGKPTFGNVVSIASPSSLGRVDLHDTPALDVVETVSPSPDNSTWQRIVYLEPTRAGTPAPQTYLGPQHLGGLDLR